MQDFWKELKASHAPRQRMTLFQFLAVCAIVVGLVLGILAWKIRFRLG